jgi:hypothetical protein
MLYEYDFSFPKLSASVVHPLGWAETTVRFAMMSLRIRGTIAIAGPLDQPKKPQGSQRKDVLTRLPVRSLRL